MVKIRRITVLIVYGFLVGILLGSLTDFGLSTKALFLLLALTFGVLSWKEGGRIFAIMAIICLGLVLGLVRFSFSYDNLVSLPSETLAKLGRPSFIGLITADPDRRDNTTRLKVGKILVVTDNFTDYKYGDKIEVTGKIERPISFLTNQNKTFDYQNYLKVRGIEYLAYYPKIKIIAHNNGSVIKATLFKLKNSFLNNLKQVLPEPSATLGGGLILGDKGGLGQQTEDEFRRAGVSHIIVLSGYNITIVAESVLKFFSWFSPAFSWLLGLGSIFLFVMMTGGEAAAVRSAVMGAIALIARRYGRTYDAGVALIAAGFLMILWNPRLLVFDLGFQLSFLATLGMIYFAPLVEKLLRSRFPSEPKIHFRQSFSDGLKELISTTTGAQLAVYPWLLLKTGTASLTGFISNIFVLPVVPFAMFLSFITGLAGFISYHLSLIISYPTYFSLSYILKLAHLFSLL